MGGPSIEPDHTIKHSAEYKSLTTHLSNKPQPLGTALDSFCGPTEDLFMQSKATSEIEAQLWHAWKAIIAAATQTPHDSAGRQKLADFVLALRDRPVLERNGKVCKVWDATVWKELPVFGAAMREAWNAGKPHRPRGNRPHSTASANKQPHSRNRPLAPPRAQRLDQPQRLRGNASLDAAFRDPCSRLERLLALRHLDDPHGARG